MIEKMSWTEFLSRAKPDVVSPPRLLALDPGDTTGWALFEYGSMVQASVVLGPDVSTRVQHIHEVIHEHKPTHIVCEEYRIYASHVDQHIYSSIPTLKLIGAIELSALLLDIPAVIKMQSAGQGKSFVKDNKLKMWGLYQFNNAHMNDAIRHGCHYLLFNHM